MSFPSVEDQLALVRRGVVQITPEDELPRMLETSRKCDRPLRVKYGIDPTGIDVHLGHTVPLRKMRQFQELGHQAVIIIGNATAMVGDPSGRDEARKNRLTKEQVEQNARDYLEQVGKVVDLDRAEIHRNGDWFGGMDFAQVLELCGKTTVQQLLVRDNFRKRQQEEKPIYLLECLYPVMQAFDSVVVGADVELGGTEQLYNFMLARTLQSDPVTCAFAEQWMSEVVRGRRLEQDGSLVQQIGVMSPILVGTDGTRRMGKSLGNYIGISEAPLEMAKKFMQLSDDVMRTYYELLTDLDMTDVDAILAGHPKEAKQTLAKNVIAQYHDATAADAAIAEWERQVAGGGLPEDIPTAEVPRADLTDGAMPAARLLKATGLCNSTGDARRSIQQGGAYLGKDKQRIESHDQPIEITDDLMLWVGKKRYCRVRVVE